MTLPFFFEENLSNQSTFILSEDTSRHVIQVLRMQKGEKLNMTNGKGHILTSQIIYENKKATEVKVLSSEIQEPPTKKTTIAISLIKNSSRFEWFLEKATEIGVSEIIPLLCERTEKQHFRYGRMRNILISAMLQSQQSWLPLLHTTTAFKQVIEVRNDAQKFIAHCNQSTKESLIDKIANSQDSTIILIGPEGDFTESEIKMGYQNSFISTSLGATRLRTETAGIVAAVILKCLNKKHLNTV
ncbi:MAG: RsmE family RNA methyltransferase [Ginsengibacter sp.]